MTTQTAAEPVRTTATRREWIGLAVLALPTLLLSLDMSVLYLALPYLSADLAPSATQQLWIMDVYGFCLAGFLITMGTLGDRIGRRRLLMIGAACFGVASVVAAYSSSAEMLIGTRAVMGIAGATLMPSTLALISNMFSDPHQRGVAIGVWMTCFMGGMTVGPLVGGALLDAFWWGSAFLLGVPVMLMLFVSAPVLLPEYRDGSASRLDLGSVALSLGTILPVIYGLKEIAQHGTSTLPLAAVLTGAGLGVAFVLRQRRLADPLVDVRLFANRGFSAALGINLFAGVVMAGTFLLMTLYLQMVAGLSPLRAGLYLVPINIAMAVATNVTPHLVRRFRPANVMAAGLVVAGVGMGVVAGVESLGGMLVGFLLAAVGIALPSVLGITFVIGSVPPARAGAASGISETSGEFGIALGVATLGSLAAAVYRGAFTVPSGVPADAAGQAREGITGAVAVADQLPVGVGADLLASAHQAFTDGLHLVSGVGAAIFCVLAVVAVVVLRDLGGDPEPEPTPAPEPFELCPVDA